MRFLLIITLGILCGGCMVGPDYHRPCIDIPDAYIYADEGDEDVINTKWWEQFDDCVLNQLIETALLYNKDVKIAAANIRRAVGVLLQTRAPLFPQIGYNNEGSRTRLSGTTFSPLTPGIPNPYDNYQALGTLSWQIDLWGQIRRETEAAQASLYASVEARRGVILMLVTSVANSYLQLRSYDEQLAISNRTMESYGEAVDYFEKQFKYGQVSQMVVAQSKTQYELAAATIPQIEAEIIAQENSLSVLLGQNPMMIPRGKTIAQLLRPSVPAGIPSEVLYNRPDIRQAEDDLIAANADIGAAEALYFPSISLTAYGGGVSQDLSRLFKGASRAWNYTGSIIGPIFTWGLIYGQVEQAKAEAQAALYNYEKVIQVAFAEVETALASYQMLQQQIEAQKRLVDAAGDYEHLSTLQYNGGYTPYFAVLQAQQQLFPAELALAETQGQLLMSLVNIYSAMGGGWVIAAEEMTSP